MQQGKPKDKRHSFLSILSQAAPELVRGRWADIELII